MKYQLALILAFSTAAVARDVGQWEHTDPVIREWYRSLKQPDNPMTSCCDLSDAYYVDLKVRDGKTVAVIVDDRPDEPLGRPHREIGTEFIIPDHKLKWDAGNPVGRTILFVGMGGTVFCLVQAGGT